MKVGTAGLERRGGTDDCNPDPHRSVQHDRAGHVALASRRPRRRRRRGRHHGDRRGRLRAGRVVRERTGRGHPDGRLRADDPDLHGARRAAGPLTPPPGSRAPPDVRAGDGRPDRAVGRPRLPGAVRCGEQGRAGPEPRRGRCHRHPGAGPPVAVAAAAIALAAAAIALYEHTFDTGRMGFNNPSMPWSELERRLSDGRRWQYP